MNRAAVPFCLVAATLLLGPPARATAQATVAPAERPRKGVANVLPIPTAREPR